MKPRDLEQYLHDHIPLSRAMQVTVLHSSPDEVTLEAPLAPNINHQETVFGGSASAVAILAGWSLLHVRLAAAGIPNRLVIQRNTMHYDQPISATFTAHARLVNQEDWELFSRTLRRKGRARLATRCELVSAGVPVGHLEASYVALRQAATAAQ